MKWDYVLNIVITGASGFIGRRLVQDFRLKGAKLLLVGRDSGRLREVFPDMDCCDYADLPARSIGFDAILHLAVLNNNVSASLQDYMRVNVELGMTVLQAAKLAGIPRFINVSTIHALDPSKKSHYATSKAIAAHNLKGVQGIAVSSIYLPAVIGERTSGRLAFLNRFPRPIRGVLLELAAALMPTIDISRVSEACWDALTEVQGPRQSIVTADQSNNLAFSLTKRGIDIVGALVILILFSWLLAVIWIAVRLQSPGPGLFAQQRVGRNGKIFTCYKFRTMTEDAPNVGTHEVPVAMVTRIGHVLRRSKLDELPQALNILRNEMTLVGPRPSLLSQTTLIKAREGRGVLAIAPGITGLAQINAIDMSQPELLAEWDERYLKLRSLKLDFSILLATAFGRGGGDAIGRGNRANTP